MPLITALKHKLMQSVASAIQTETTKHLTPAQITALAVPPSPNPALEALVFATASRVALALAPTIPTWSHLRDIKSYNSTNTALTTSHLLTTTLLASPSLAPFAPLVRTMTNSTRCITLIRFPTHAIVIDLAAQPTAFIVEQGVAFECQERLDMLTQEAGAVAYVYAAGQLVECTGLKSKMQEELLGGLVVFRDLTAADLDLAVPELCATCVGDMPAAHTICVRSIWDHEPENQHITFSAMGENEGMYIVDTMALRVSFAEQEIRIAVPGVDWLAKPANAWYREQLPMYFKVEECGFHLSGAVVFLELALGKEDVLDLPVNGMDGEVWYKVRLMDDVCAQLGMSEGEVCRIAHVVCDVWRQALVETRARDEEFSKVALMQLERLSLYDYN